MGITDFWFSFCCEKVGGKLLGVEWSSLLFCFTGEYTFPYFQVIFCFLFNYHTEVNLFSFSWGSGDGIHLQVLLVNKLFMCRTFPCSMVRYQCSGSLLLAWAVRCVSHNNTSNDLFWKIRSTWFGKMWAAPGTGLSQGSPLGLGSKIWEGIPSMAPWEYNVRKENLVQLISAGTWRLPLFNLYTCEWLNLKDFGSEAKLIFWFSTN